LPEKVKERYYPSLTFSGEGFTLSGKQLDPNSASARSILRNFSYLCKPSDLSADDFLESSAVHLPAPKPPTKKRASRDPDEFYSPADTSNVVSSRPKRARESRPIHFDHGDHVSPHSLITLDPLEIQPFESKVGLTAYIVMMVHGLLFSTEIIGLLAGVSLGLWVGKYDEKGKILDIQLAMPCQAVNTLESNDAEQMVREKNVEMDPVSLISVKEEISRIGLNVVGWYHSHPGFMAQPSLIDIENQRAYQGLFGGDGAPFVAGIYSTIESERFALFMLGDNDCAGKSNCLIISGGLNYIVGEKIDVEQALKGVEQCVMDGGDDMKEFDEVACGRIREAWPTGDSGVEEFIVRLKRSIDEK
jgi:proteasome lid subunit RPN8/RPN11